MQPLFPAALSLPLVFADHPHPAHHLGDHGAVHSGDQRAHAVAHRLAFGRVPCGRILAGFRRRFGHGAYIIGNHRHGG